MTLTTNQMEFIAFLLLIVILVLLITLRNSFSDRMQRLENELWRVNEKLGKISAKAPVAEQVQSYKEASVEGPIKSSKEAPVAEPAKPVEETDPAHPTVSIASTPSVTTEGTTTTTSEKWQSGFKIEDSHSSHPKAEEKTNTQAEPIKTPTPYTNPKAPQPGFFERHPDLEKFIGENLVSKIGIAILVLAIGYFVKYAIDNDWIGPVGRVAIGLLCGGILVGFAHFTRNSYKSFSSVLIGGGLAVFYFTITLAYHQFGLFSQTGAFIIMVVITAFAVLLSVLYNRQELAIIALVGGFVSPFMVSSGDGDYMALFMYLIILNIGLLAIAYQKAWRLLNLLAFLFTILLFAGWLITLDENEVVVTYRNGFIFAGVFYLLFFAINIAHTIRKEKRFIASDFGILLSNTGLYFATGLYCLNEMYAEEFRGFFCIALAIFNLVVSYALLRKNNVDKNILYLLIAITLTFISLTAPIQLDGNNITLFWSTETVLLYWLFQKSQITIIRTSSLIIWGCMLVSLLMDWATVYADSSSTLTVIANRGFITTLFSAICTFGLFLLKRKETAAEHRFISKEVYFIAALVLLYASGFLEINHQFRNHYPFIRLNVLYLLFYTSGFILLLKLADAKDLLQNASRKTITAIMLVGIVFYLLTVRESYYTQRQMLEHHIYTNHYIIHWLGAVLSGLIIYQLFTMLRQAGKKDQEAFYTWPFCAIIVIFLTVEVHLVVNALFYSADHPMHEIQRVFIKAGWPILWGLCSFAFMWLGMKHKFRTLRIASLTLFAVTLVKLFAYDIRNIPVAGKIAAFFSLGVLLLVVSFMYQRLKKIIIDQEEKPEAGGH